MTEQAKIMPRTSDEDMFHVYIYEHQFSAPTHSLPVPIFFNLPYALPATKSLSSFIKKKKWPSTERVVSPFFSHCSAFCSLWARYNVVQPWGHCMESNCWKNTFRFLSPFNRVQCRHLRVRLARTSQEEVAPATWMKWTSLVVPIVNHRRPFLAQLLNSSKASN